MLGKFLGMVCLCQRHVGTREQGKRGGDSKCHLGTAGQGVWACLGLFPIVAAGLCQNTQGAQGLEAGETLPGQFLSMTK